ncbi:unnamed protein product [Arctogadus glacialis]
MAREEKHNQNGLKQGRKSTVEEGGRQHRAGISPGNKGRFTEKLERDGGEGSALQTCMTADVAAPHPFFKSHSSPPSLPHGQDPAGPEPCSVDLRLNKVSLGEVWLRLQGKRGLAETVLTDGAHAAVTLGV